MQCPNDQSVLVMSERKGVEIDYCPTCRGVWLDRGELDKIIDRAIEAEIAAEARGPLATTSEAPPSQVLPSPSYPPATSYRPGGYDERRYDDRRPDRRYDEGHRKRKKKESWLEDLFDF